MFPSACVPRTRPCCASGRRRWRSSPKPATSSACATRSSRSCANGSRRAEADKARHLDISPALLDGAQQLVDRFGADLPPAMRDFVAASSVAAEARGRREREEQERRLRDAEALALANRRTARRTGVGLVAALLFAAAAGWQWQVAQHQAREAETQRDRAERTLALATMTANSLVFDLAQKFRNRRRRAGGDDQGHSRQGAPVAGATSGRQRAEPGTPPQPGRRIDGNEHDAAHARRHPGRSGGGARGTATSCRPCWRNNPTARCFNAICRCRTPRLATFLSPRQSDGGAEILSASLAIGERLAKSDPGNAGWQRDLSVSYDKVGDVLVAQGNLAEALKSYRGEPRHQRAPGQGRSRQCRLAARSLGVVQQGRRRAGGAGQSRRRR